MLIQRKESSQSEEGERIAKLEEQLLAEQRKSILLLKVVAIVFFLQTSVCLKQAEQSRADAEKDQLMEEFEKLEREFKLRLSSIPFAHPDARSLKCKNSLVETELNAEREAGKKTRKSLKACIRELQKENQSLKSNGFSKGLCHFFLGVI